MPLIGVHVSGDKQQTVKLTDNLKLLLISKQSLCLGRPKTSGQVGDTSRKQVLEREGSHGGKTRSSQIACVS